MNGVVRMEMGLNWVGVVSERRRRRLMAEKTEKSSGRIGGLVKGRLR